MSEQSFSQKVKEEMISRINSVQRADACLYGMLICANELGQEQIDLLTESTAVSDFFVKNCERICGEGKAAVRETDRGQGAVMYDIAIDSQQARKKLLDYFKIEGGRISADKKYPPKKLYASMIGGMFLACGSLNDPQKGYHLEMTLPDLETCNRLGLMLIDNFGLLAKNVERKNRQILYFKESENIIDMLALMGATTASFEIMNVKIFKDMRNKVNREVNCVNANIEKTVRAAAKQIEDIKLIEDTDGLSSLPDNLRETALLRYKNPDLNLSELGQEHDPPISRSGVNHRLKRISQTAERIRKRKV